MSFTARLDTVIETPRLVLKVPSLKEFEREYLQRALARMISEEARTDASPPDPGDRR